VPDLAARIASDFASYTSGNPDVHLSAGMAFIHGKYPVYQAAEDAGDALNLAKDKNGKNAFAFLEWPWSWNDFTDLRQKFDLLVTASRDHKAPAQLLQLLQQLANMDQEEKKRHGRPVMGRWLWMAITSSHA
jgi:CRISPR-associated protein Csm1